MATLIVSKLRYFCEVILIQDNFKFARDLVVLLKCCTIESMKLSKLHFTSSNLQPEEKVSDSTSS